LDILAPIVLWEDGWLVIFYCIKRVQEPNLASRLGDIAMDMRKKIRRVYKWMHDYCKCTKYDADIYVHTVPFVDKGSSDNIGVVVIDLKVRG
jgi:hypothetical protein